MKLSSPLSGLLFFAIASVLAWALLFTDIWALVVLAGFAAGMFSGGRNLVVFPSGLAAGTVATAVWLMPLLTPGSAAYVNAVGALASIPGGLLVSLSFVFTALFVACGGILGTWARGMAARLKARA